MAADSYRSHFTLPTNKDVGATRLDPETVNEASAYLCGNSLGLLPKRSEELVKEELKIWGTRAVQGHFDHPHGREWKNITDHVNPLLAELVGAKPGEVACMGTLTANLHLMMNTFYKPTNERYKILCEAHAFPSDQYAFESQVSGRGYDPDDAIIELSPRPGEFVLREEDILDTIARRGAEIALVIFSGVQYYTGQYFPIEAITRKGKEQGCTVGWDLAHAVGNVPLELHNWGVDFGVWCSYKYLNSGPGGIAGLFVHERWDDTLRTGYAGWWGHDPATRFQMPKKFTQIRGAQGFAQSNPSVLAVASLLGSLEIFKQAGGISALRVRSQFLTGLLERGLVASKYYVQPSTASTHTKPGFTIITPSDPASRGAQLSLLFLPPSSGLMEKVFDGMEKLGIVGDERRPDVIRFAPIPLYNNEDDVRRCVEGLEQVLGETIG